jgi:outer membrane protein assembly factor BamB
VLWSSLRFSNATLTADGTVVAWGDSEIGDLDPESGSVLWTLSAPACAGGNVEAVTLTSAGGLVALCNDDMLFGAND